VWQAHKVEPNSTGFKTNFPHNELCKISLTSRYKVRSIQNKIKEHLKLKALAVNGLTSNTAATGMAALSWSISHVG
jgi:hypothetical protein